MSHSVFWVPGTSSSNEYKIVYNNSRNRFLIPPQEGNCRIAKTATECELNDPKGNNLKILKFFSLSSATDHETFRNFNSFTMLSILIILNNLITISKFLL